MSVERIGDVEVLIRVSTNKDAYEFDSVAAYHKWLAFLNDGDGVTAYEELQSRVAVLEKALRFYADEKNYLATHEIDGERTGWTHVEGDNGVIAREALEGK